MRRSLPVLAAAAAMVAVSCVSRRPAPATARVEPPALSDGQPRDYAGLHNVVAYHDGYYSGGAPKGDAGFDTLRAMRVRTIISVDSAAPDLAAARSRAMRYIHLPIGYSGFDQQRKLELVRATRDAMRDGPVYVHCHHGKHRSAGAAAVVAASLGWSTPEEGVARMKVSGTAPNYTGLYACAASAVVLDAAAIDAVPADFPSIHHPQGLVQAMVELDHATEHLLLIERSGWTTPAEHPDLVPAAEAGRLADLFRVSADSERVRAEPAEFRSMMRSTGADAQVLEDMLAAGESDPARLSGRFKLVVGACTDCHAKYRD